jgi:flagellar hook-associated protein 3 FlgL
MSISSIQNGYFQSQLIDGMQTQLTQLQTELGTGEVSQNYAGIGDDRGLAIALQSQLSSITNYGNVISTVGTRLTTAQAALSAIDAATNQVAGAFPNSPFTLNQNGQTADQTTATGELGQVIDALNTQVGGTYLFSGTASTTPSVTSMNDILNGNGSQAGLDQVISERAQADLGANGLGRLVIPAPGNSPATVEASGAALAPDAIASLTGADISSLSATGGTLVINGQSITINPGDDATAILGDINGAAATTGVSAWLDSGHHLVLQSANAATGINIGGGSSASALSDLGLSVGMTNPVNLVTQGAVTAPQTLTIAVGANPALTVTFGTGAGQVSTLAGLEAALSGPPGLAGGTASVDPATGNLSVTALNGSDSITLGGTANLAAFGVAVGTTPPSTGTQASLSEDVAGSVFGMKIAGVSSSLTGATVTGPSGSPAGVSVDLATNPNPGDSLTYTFNLPDGTTQQLTLTATTSSSPGADQFTIGSTPAATASNLQAALTTGVKTIAATSLTAASAVEAANDFFQDDPPLRVAGPPFTTATSLVAGTSANTVSWYTGENGSTPARDTATAQIDSSLSISFGMRANEPALTTAVENLAVFSAMSFSASDPNASARYTALTQRLGTNLSAPSGSQTVSDIEDDIANAQTAVQTVTTNQTQASTTLQDMLQNIVGTSSTNVGEQILNLQTRLQASLQVTALLAKTNLVSLLAPLG